MAAKSKGAEGNIIFKAYRINEIIEQKMNEFKINGTIVRDLIVKHIEQLEQEKPQHQMIMTLN